MKKSSINYGNFICALSMTIHNYYEIAILGKVLRFNLKIAGEVQNLNTSICSIAKLKFDIEHYNHLCG